MNGQNLTKFCIHIVIDKIYVGSVKLHFFGKFATELRLLIDVRIWFLLNTLRINNQNLTKFFILIITDKIYVLIVMDHQCFKHSYAPVYPCPLIVLRRGYSQILCKF